MRYLTPLLAFAVLAAGQSVKSPGGQLSMRFEITQAGQLTYAVDLHGKPLIAASALKLDLQGQRPLGANVRLAGSQASSGEENYRLVTGKVSEVRDRYNALRLDVEETGGSARKLTIEARAFDDAVAFRYVVPEQPSLREFRLAKENTEFRIAKDATTWALILPHYRSMYESEFVKMPASGFSNQGGVASTVLLGLPLLFEVPGVGWAAITEADMRDYAAMYLVNPSGSWTGHWFESRLSPDPGEPEIAVTGHLPHHSPWRIIMAADDPGRLVESNVVTSLNPPQAIQDTSWIRAGKAAWDWWSGSLNAEGKRAFTTENIKYYVDFAARSGLEYMLVDAGWSARGDITAMNGTIDVPELVRYGAAKNVKIWIWLHYAQLDRQMDEAFPLYEKWGVAGVKIDFLSRDDQQMTRFYYRTAQKAAEHHLMVDIHGSTKPTGMNRTWPNVVGYEAVLGMEQSKAGARDNPEHHVTLPFTRMLVGQMDYTPGAFENSTREDFVPRMLNPMVMGTRAHQLAMYAVYEAAIQMVADHPGAYRDQPAFGFIRAAPATWDETKVLNGRPGEFITVARRKGNEWFLGSMTNWSARKLDVPLSFLGAGQYRAEIYADAPDADRSPKNVSIQRKTMDRTARLPIEMAPGGGCAVRFVPVNR